jgi:mRNA interferase MazF
MPKPYVPSAGDIIYLTFDPQAGHEQAGRRPALVVSPATFNGGTGFVICCPITNTINDNPFTVWVPNSCRTTGAILVDQLKSLDWHERQAERIEAIPSDSLIFVRNLIARILKFPTED